MLLVALKMVTAPLLLWRFTIPSQIIGQLRPHNHNHWIIQLQHPLTENCMLLGGYLDRTVLSNKLSIYDSNTNQWTQGANLPTARGALTANFIGGTLYVVGGVNTEKTLTRYFGI